jgi:ornithine cyclodeaminase/alanine dehydrogenase-like protein (mu-crystallin family)
MPDCLAAMEQAYRELGEGRGVNGVRSEILTPTSRPDALYALLTMGGVVPSFGVGAVRINSDILTWPQSGGGTKRVKVPAAPNQRYVGLVLLFSSETGEPLAIFPDGLVQRMRAGATSGLGAKYLAREDACELALLGTGWQAGGQAMAAAAVRKLRRIRCYSPDPQRRRDFSEDMSRRLGLEVVPAESAQAAVRGADMVLCATNSMEPVLPPDWIERGMHVSSLKRLELDPAIAARADVIVTHVHEGTSQIRRGAGADLARDTDAKRDAVSRAIGAEESPTLAELLLGRAKGRTSPEQVSLFLNYAGIGYQFAATGHVVYRRARALGLGREIDTDWLTSELIS